MSDTSNAVVCADCGGRGLSGEVFSSENCAHVRVVELGSLSTNERKAYEGLSFTMSRSFAQIRAAKDALLKRARADGVLVQRALPAKVRPLHAVT